MSVHKSLVLDHFFFAASDEEFIELKTLFESLECAEYQHVKTDGDSWEGLYIWTRSQFYLEVLKKRRPNCAGVCQKPRSPLSNDGRDIVQDFPELPWNSFDRSLDGQRWFTALSCDNYLDLETPFNTWVMHYYQAKRDTVGTFKMYEIQTISEFEVVASPSLAERIRLNSTWFNAEKTYRDDEVTFDFQTYYSDPMKLKIQLRPNTKGIQFKKLKLEFVRGFNPAPLENLELKHFRFSKVGNHFELESLPPHS